MHGSLEGKVICKGKVLILLITLQVNLPLLFCLADSFQYQSASSVSHKKRVYNFFNLLSILISAALLFSVCHVFLEKILKMIGYELQKRSVTLKVLKRSGKR